MNDENDLNYDQDPSDDDNYIPAPPIRNELN